MGKRLVGGKNNYAFNPRGLSQTVVLIFGLAFAIGFKSFAQNSQPSEYQIKAAFVYNFAKFVEWPTQALAAPTSPMVIGMLGENVFHGDLEKTIRGKAINDHPLQFKKFDSVAEATNCQVLFIGPSEKKHLPKILESLRGTSVLTVSETDEFIENGGMINLVIVDNRVRFQINNEAAKKAGLTISSKLLSLAISNH
jgi:YfiR/HmsC-like